MTNPNRKQAMETIWRRELTTEERARLEKQLTGDEGGLRFIEEEEALSRLLKSLPDAPLSTNFTARVMMAVRSERARTASVFRVPGGEVLWRLCGSLRHSWVAQSTAAGLALAISLSTYYGLKSYRSHQLAQTLAAVTKEGGMPEIEVLKDFDAIRHFGSAQASKTTIEMDAALLAALQ